MVSRSEIENKLKYLDRQFQKAQGVRSSLFYSKISLLELSGLTEDSIDKIIRHCVYCKLKTDASKKYLHDNIIDPVYGFKFKKHFKEMIIRSIGLIGYEKLISSIDLSIWLPLESKLNDLYSKRTTHAHTELKRTMTIDAPSVTLRNFSTIYNGLKECEQSLKKLLN